MAAKEELGELAAAPEDPAELDDPITNPDLTTAAGEPAEVYPMSSSEGDYTQAMVLKEEGRLKEAVELFHSAARDTSMRLKAYSQVGWCYVKMKEHHAAIQAFRAALNDPMAMQQDILDVLYMLGRSLESVGLTGQALEVYDRINQSTSTYKDVVNRLRELQQMPKPSSHKGQACTEKHSWFNGVVDHLQRFLIGSQK